RIVGAREVGPDAIQQAAHVRVDEPLPVPVDQVDLLGERVARHYHDEGYRIASVTVAFASSTGDLSFDINEGIVDSVEFTGVDDRLKQRFAEEFALKAGDVFQSARARQALEGLLRPTRGAVRPGRIMQQGSAFDEGRESDTAGPRNDARSFQMVDRNGEHVLLVGLRAPAGRFKLVPDLGDREDWFSSVDGFVPSLGFGAAVFDHDQFNHAFVAGHLSYKTASDRVGYSIGFERPFFRSPRLYVGGELRDLTASDDQWQVSSLEASLSAIGPRSHIRDYYRERGLQVSAAYRIHPQVELVAAWRSERQETLPTESDFSFWNGAEATPGTPPVGGGR